MEMFNLQYASKFPTYAPISPHIFAGIAVFSVKKGWQAKKVIHIIQTGADPTKSHVQKKCGALKHLLKL